MQEPLDVVRDFSLRSDRARIACMLTGSMAMNYYATPRMTRDIDIVIAVEPRDVPAVLAMLGSDYFVFPEAVEEAVFARSMFNIIHSESLIKIDCIVEKPTTYHQQAFSRRVRVQIENFSAWIIQKDDLIICKLDWAKDSLSELQLADVRNLMATGYDRRYVEDWTERLGLTTVLAKAQT